VSASLTGDFAGLRRLIRAARHLATPKGQAGVVKAAAWGALSALEERFATATDPKGRPWKPSLRAQLEGGQTLSDTGRLRRSFSVRAAGSLGVYHRHQRPLRRSPPVRGYHRPQKGPLPPLPPGRGAGEAERRQGPVGNGCRVDLPARPFFPEGNDLGRYAPHMAEAIQAYLRRTSGMIRDFYAALKAALPAIPFYLGADALGERAAPPRLVLVPTDEGFAPASAITAPQAPASVATRLVGLQLWLWGEGYEEVEGMLAEVITALRRTFGPSVVELERGRWEEGGAISRGVAYVLDIRARMPVAETRTYVTLEAIAQRCGGLGG
jgi:hypothetical protein